MFDMRIIWGKRKTFELEVRDADDALVDLDGKTLRFTAKASYSDADPSLIDKSSGDGIIHDAEQAGAGKGLATLILEPADTNSLDSIDADRLNSLPAQLEFEQTPNQPEVLDSGTLTIEPVVRRSV